MTIPPIIGYIAAWYGVCQGIWFLFDKVEENLNPHTKNAISNWLINLKPAGSKGNWSIHFVHAFDSVFGENLFSAKSFSRSCAASLISAAICFCLWVALRPGNFSKFLSDFLSINVFSFFFLTAVLNFIPDYISLIESRYIIGIMSRNYSFFNVIFWLLVDLAVTASIWIIWMLLFMVIAGSPNSFFDELKNAVLLLNVRKSSTPSYGIFFYTTFFTSIWVWLYAISGMIFKTFEYLGIGLSKFKNIFNLKHKPLRSMGIMAIIIITIIFAVMPFFLESESATTSSQQGI